MMWSQVYKSLNLLLIWCKLVIRAEPKKSFGVHRGERRQVERCSDTLRLEFCALWASELTVAAAAPPLAKRCRSP